MVKNYLGGSTTISKGSFGTFDAAQDPKTETKISKIKSRSVIQTLSWIAVKLVNGKKIDRHPPKISNATRIQMNNFKTVEEWAHSRSEFKEILYENFIKKIEREEIFKNWGAKDIVEVCNELNLELNDLNYMISMVEKQIKQLDEEKAINNKLLSNEKSWDEQKQFRRSINIIIQSNRRKERALDRLNTYKNDL